MASFGCTEILNERLRSELMQPQGRPIINYPFDGVGLRKAYSYAREVCGRAVSGPQINPLFF